MTRRSNHVVFVFALCCAALLAAACSKVWLGYGAGPTVLAWQASRYFDLDSAQQAQLRARLEYVREWHRGEELPRVIATLDEARRRIAGEVSLQDAQWLVASAQQHYRSALGRAIDETADLAAGLSPSQLAALQRKFADNDEEFVEEWIEPAEEAVRRARFERVLDDVEEWLGPLSLAQRQWLRVRLDAIPVQYAAWRADRLRRQGEFVELLQTRIRGAVRPAAMGESGAAQLRRWALDWDRGRSPEELARIDRFMRDFSALAVDLLNGATPAQREHLRRRLEDYIADLSGQLH